MALTIAGILGIENSETTFVNTVGQVAVYDAVTEYASRLSEDLLRISNLFVQGVTENHKWRYYLPGDGELLTQGGMARAAERKIGGSYDVALPIFQWGDALGNSFIDVAYMSIADIDRQVAAIRDRARRTMRRQILSALLDNVTYTFDDKKQGTLTIKPLANNDTDLYPPVVGSDVSATANHYAETGYAVAAISDANNPVKTVSDALYGRYEGQTVDMLAFVAANVAPYVEGLTEFEPITDPRIQKGANADNLINIPASIPGKVLGRINETWVVRWSDLPSNYVVGINPNGEKPLQMRVDPAYTNLPRNLTLIKQSDEFPLEKSEWMWRFGMGVTNRLNGYVLEVANGGGYTVPTGFSH